MRGASSSGVGIKVLERNETQTNGNVPSTEAQENKAVPSQERREQILDSSSTEAQEKKTVSSQELREQILNSFIQVLSATGKDDQLIQKIIPKINKVFKAQEKFIKKDLAEKRIIRRELGEGVDESFKDELKTLEKKSETLAVQGGMISKVKALIKVSLEQNKIDELKEDLESKLNLLNVREEELADGASKQFFDNYLRGKKYYPDLLKAFPSVIRSVENAITPDNKEKMEKRIKYLNKLGEDIIKEELKKLENDYQGGEKNHPAILKKLPDIIEFLIVIRTSDEKHIVENKKLIKSLDGKYKEMLAKRGKIRRPENSLQESDDVESASLSPIMDELEEQVKGGGEKLLDRHGKPMKGDGDEVAKQYAPKGLSPQSRSALGSGLVSANTSGEVSKNKFRQMQRDLTPKVDKLIHQFTEGAMGSNNGHESKEKNTSRSLLLEFGTEGSDKKIGEDERDREERLKMLLTKHDDEKFKKEVTQQKSESGIGLEVKLGSSPLITNEAPETIHHEELMARQKERQNQLEELIRYQVELMKGGGDEVAKQYAPRSLSPEFQKKGSDNKIFKSERDREFQKDVENLENNRLALQRIYNNLNDKKFTECDLEKLDKTIKQIHIYNDIFIELTLNKYGIDRQAVRSPEAKTISPRQIVKYPPAPTLPPKPGNSYKSPPKDSQTAIPSVYSPKVNSFKVNPVYSPQPILLSAYPIANVAHFNPNSLPEYRQQPMVSATYYVNPSYYPHQYYHVPRGPDVYSQVPQTFSRKVSFNAPPTTTSVNTSIYPQQLSPQNNSRFP